jgi:hypothetical protein
MPVKASAILKRNIHLLLKRHQMRQGELARWCGKDRSWISKVLTSDNRGIPLKHLDRVARFFGIETYQLFTPEAASRLGMRLTPRERALLAKYRALTPEEQQRLEHAADVLVQSQDASARTAHHETHPGIADRSVAAFRRVRRSK